MTGARIDRCLRAGAWIGVVLAMAMLIPRPAPAQTPTIDAVSKKIQALEKERRDIAGGEAFIERELRMVADPSTVVIMHPVGGRYLPFLVTEDYVLAQFWASEQVGGLSWGPVALTMLTRARAAKGEYQDQLVAYRRALESKDERLHSQLSYYLNERARLTELKTGSQESKGGSGRWQSVGMCYCTGKDIDRSNGPTPDPAKCRVGSGVKTAVCWSTWCTYKTEPVSTCSGGANPGQMYSCR